MDYFRQFVIPFSGLKQGIHRFDFEADDLFFEHFEYSEIKNGRISVGLNLTKEENLLVLDFTFDGQVTLPCDRCFEPVDLRIQGKNRLCVKYGSGYYEENEALQIIPEGETQFNVSPFIYEFIHLLLPVKRIHPEDENGESRCNPEVLKMLEDLSEKHAPDPRWEVLNDLLKNNPS
jgi:uncharacterized metal-binding protein YceD (DUF177 family)